MTFPITLFSVGAILLLIMIVGRSVFVIAGAVGFLMAAAGLCMLPFGLVTAIRRRKPVVLRCPRCGAQSHSAPRPFRVDRPEEVDYAYVVCSVCGADFTVDRFTRLT